MAKDEITGASARAQPPGGDAEKTESIGAAGGVRRGGRGTHGSSAVTQGIRVAVEPSYLNEQSDPTDRRYVFGYHVRISNEGKSVATLVSRRWLIVDATGEAHEVRGEGVVGQQPRLAPGDAFEYASYCPLRTPWGTMEGSYRFQREDGTYFEARVERFYLVSTR